MADNLVRLGLAFSVILLISATFYTMKMPRAVAVEPAGISSLK
jgi:hypothetical protein